MLGTDRRRTDSQTISYRAHAVIKIIQLEKQTPLECTLKAFRFQVLVLYLVTINAFLLTCMCHSYTPDKLQIIYTTAMKLGKKPC